MKIFKPSLALVRALEGKEQKVDSREGDEILVPFESQDHRKVGLDGTS